MYGGFSRSVFGSVSGRSSPESVSEDLAEPSSGYHDKFATSLGGTGKNSQIQIYKLLMNAKYEFPFFLFSSTQTFKHAPRLFERNLQRQIWIKW